MKTVSEREYKSSPEYHLLYAIFAQALDDYADALIFKSGKLNAANAEEFIHYKEDGYRYINSIKQQAKIVEYNINKCFADGAITVPFTSITSYYMYKKITRNLHSYIKMKTLYNTLKKIVGIELKRKKPHKEIHLPI